MPGRDRTNAQGLIKAGGHAILDIPEERPDRGQSAIACAHAAAAPVLNMVEKGQDQVRVEILDLKIGWPTLQPIGSELDQQNETVSVGLHGVRADGAVPREMFAQVCREIRGERRHAASPR